jgi:2-polyprenyl-3-methyl-5-hydroxy-6-metoxy-1,4-benzoquinol methylase
MGSASEPPCRLCGSPRVVHWGDKRGRARADVTFAFHRCLACDFRFVEPVTGPEIYNDDYYEGRGVDPLVDYATEYRDYAATPRIEEFRGLTDLVAAKLSRRISRDPRAPLPSTVEWLDFGCGAGGLLKWLRDSGALSVAGRSIPLAPCGSDVGVYADRLRERDGFRILDERQLAALPDAQFDVISLIEVIEHVERPAEVLALCSRLLRPGGLLLLTTGNLASPLARWQGVGFAYCIPEIHISLWTPRSLELAYDRVGLAPLRVRCDGSIRFKIRKNLARAQALAPFGFLWLSRPMVAALDWLFGASRMPMAVKP